MRNKSVLAIILCLCAACAVMARESGPTPGDSVYLLLREGTRVAGVLQRRSNIDWRLEVNGQEELVPAKRILAFRTPDESEVRWLVRAGGTLLREKKSDEALLLFLRARTVGGPTDSLSLWIAECFFLRRDYKAALGTNFGIPITGSGISAPAVYQRVRILCAMSMQAQALKTYRIMKELLPGDPYCDSAAVALGLQRDRMAWRPRLGLAADASDGQQETAVPDYAAGNLSGMRDTLVKKFDSRLALRLSVPLYQVAGVRLDVGPSGSLRVPLDRDYAQRWTLGGDMSLHLTSSTRPVEHTFSLDYTHGSYNNLAPVHSVSLQWQGVRVSADKGFWMSVVGGTLQRSDECSQNGFYLYATAARQPVISFGRLVVRLSGMGMCSSYRDNDTRWKGAQQLEAQGLSDGATIYDTSRVRLYDRQDRVIPAIAGKFYNPDTLFAQARVLPDRRLGSWMEPDVLSGQLRLGVGITLWKWISADVDAGGAAHYFTQWPVWDNTANAFLDGNNVLIVHDRVQNRDYFVSDLLKGTCTQLVEYSVQRIDWRGTLRIGLKVSPPRMGSMLLYCRLTQNWSTLGEQSPFRAQYREIVPGVSWSVEF